MKPKRKENRVPLSHSNESADETKKATKDPNVFIPSPSKRSPKK